MEQLEVLMSEQHWAQVLDYVRFTRTVNLGAEVLIAVRLHPFPPRETNHSLSIYIR